MPKPSPRPCDPRCGWGAPNANGPSCRQRLRAAQSEIEHFAAQVCHDVEEPLRAVTTFVQLVEERSEAGFTENERGYLDHVLTASARVRCLLRGFLGYAQAGHGRLAHFGRLDLRSAAAAAVQSLRRRVEESHTTIVFEQPWPWWCGAISVSCNRSSSK